MMLLIPCAQGCVTALVWASLLGHLKVVQALLAAGANKDTRGDVRNGVHRAHSYTPIHATTGN